MISTEDIPKYTVKSDRDIKSAIKKLDEGGRGFLAVVDEDDRVVGIISDGDFRRAILSGIKLSENVLKISNRNFKYLTVGYSTNDVINIFRTERIQCVPILRDGKIVEILTEETLLNLSSKEERYEKIDIPIIIMAGGKGTRMAPFTQILPKPLIPIGDKSVIEVIIEKFLKHYVTHFFISVNFKTKIIKSYFEELNCSYTVEFIEEEKPLGTAGSLRLLKNLTDANLLVTNCDIIIDAKYDQIISFHVANNNDITIVASLKHYNIPYGICTLKNDGRLKEITEKPELSFLVNTGMYLLKTSVLTSIPQDEYFDMTSLIERINKNGGKIGVFPINESAWIDIGEWVEYKKAVQNFNLVNYGKD